MLLKRVLCVVHFIKMFVSQGRAMRKTFQKPNILKRKSNVVRLKSQKNNESPEKISLMSNCGLYLSPSSEYVESIRGCNQSVQIVQAPNQFNVVEVKKRELETSETLDIYGDSLTIYAHAQEDNNDLCIAQSPLNVESFLNDGVVKQNETSSTKMETNRPKWCIDFMSEDSKDNVITNDCQIYDGSLTSKNSSSRDDTAVASLLTYEIKTQQNLLDAQNHDYVTNTDVTDIQALKHLSGPVKLKCDIPNCDKSFWTEARLQKHKNAHKNGKHKKTTILSCPVKKTNEDGVEVKCDRTFLVRSQLMNHLNDDHTPEDALYGCSACGRRFFWAGGVRTHQANACDRAFACAWAGCNRVFRQPCRLREHARAHTGDRPYACSYPNCEWSFRSASKLMRHARRHTDERRHACGTCGRAFLRREHLREHTARHNARAHACTHTGCEQTFKSTNSLLMHTKKVHMKNEVKPAALKRGQKNSKGKKNMFLISLIETQPPKVEEDVENTTVVDTAEPITEDIVEPMCIEDDVDISNDVIEQDERSARTHCTWPLERQQSDYSIEEDNQLVLPPVGVCGVEQSEEGSESNIYTVRSDLFLHGNVLINEDSEFIRIDGSSAGASAAAEAEAAGLGGIDVHPTIDLMQEELMYVDAVDESSLRVFLLNGEELS